MEIFVIYLETYFSHIFNVKLQLFLMFEIYVNCRSHTHFLTYICETLNKIYINVKKNTFKHGIL